MKYDVIAVIGYKDFVNIVNNRLDTGWKLQGGVSCVNVSSGLIMYLQAMCLNTTDKPISD